MGSNSSKGKKGLASAATPVSAARRSSETLPTAGAAANQELDIAFGCDCTGSMSAYIRSAQDNIVAIAQQIHDRTTNGSVSVRYALVKYRDHPPQDSTFATEVHPFTHDIKAMKRNVDTMSAQGGGDGPESVCCALHELLELSWRPNATKVCVLISDAPPHGLGESGDGFPNGCPLNRDPLAICRELAAKGVIVYAVAVEPVLSREYKFARDFMIAVAKITEGKFLPLGKAEILANVIVGGALEGLSMDAVWRQVEAEIDQEAKAQGTALSEQERVVRTSERLAAHASSDAAAPKVHSVDVETPYYNEHYDHFNADKMVNAKGLRECAQKLDAKRNAHVAAETEGYNWQEQKALCSDAVPMSKEVQLRCVQKQSKSRGLL